jgi:hypothetical protein
VDKIPKKAPLNDSPSHQDVLAQPLKLKDSLRIRDGLRGHDAHSVGCPQLRVIRITSRDLGYFWVSNN